MAEQAVRVAAIEEMFGPWLRQSSAARRGSLIYGSPMCWLPQARITLIFAGAIATNEWPPLESQHASS